METLIEENVNQNTEFIQLKESERLKESEIHKLLIESDRLMKKNEGFVRKLSGSNASLKKLKKLGREIKAERSISSSKPSCDVFPTSKSNLRSKRF